ncbi:hypothetical protein FC093_16480 [Ilyomonas limi]|uniref:Uncharacterized protein n=1 Tax=Ilyomonas limi TaxID=2575867 RepID=A0A4U3KW89_9BACT|nr:hypothetical protein [Ilyomonas limi]TKK66632.1 hypothetical protein FC093_16480 [Ilyomonas limi]
MNYYVVKYSGPFGFIKPWTAVRDSETFSQQFLTQSILAGIERKLFPELLNEPFGIYRIKSNRLSYEQVSSQQEQIQTRGWNSTKQKGNKTILFERNTAIIIRGILINPTLLLAFEEQQFAEAAFKQHICLCRNEDILYPEEIIETDKRAFNSDDEKFAGFELVFEKTDKSFLVGYNRFDNNNPMYGWLKIVGTPVKEF